MAHPKRKSRKQEEIREDTLQSYCSSIATCLITIEAHLYHRAYWHEGKMYYRGQVVIDKSVAVA
jgi:large subunit ribosomal protein L32